MVRLASTFVFIVSSAVTGFNLQRSFVVTSTRPLQPHPQQRQSVVVGTPLATTSSNEEATTTTSILSDDSNSDETLPSTSTKDTANINADSPLIVVNGHNIELTSSLVEYINKRIGNILSKLAKNGAVRECDVVLSVNKNPKVNEYDYIYVGCCHVDPCLFCSLTVLFHQ